MYYQNQSNLSFLNFFLRQNHFFFLRSKDRIVNSQSKITRCWALKKLPLTEKHSKGEPFQKVVMGEINI